MAYIKTIWTDDVTLLNAANMNHIEDGIAALDSEKLSKNGGTMSGGISIGYNQQTDSGISMNQHKITNLGEPTNPRDATTKQYVDGRITIPETSTATTVANYIKIGNNEYQFPAGGTTYHPGNNISIDQSNNINVDIKQDLNIGNNNILFGNNNKINATKNCISYGVGYTVDPPVEITIDLDGEPLETPIANYYKDNNYTIPAVEGMDFDIYTEPSIVGNVWSVALVGVLGYPIDIYVKLSYDISSNISIINNNIHGDYIVKHNTYTTEATGGISGTCNWEIDTWCSGKKTGTFSYSGDMEEVTGEDAPQYIKLSVVHVPYPSDISTSMRSSIRGGCISGDIWRFGSFDNYPGQSQGQEDFLIREYDLLVNREQPFSHLIKGIFEML